MNRNIFGLSPEIMEQARQLGQHYTIHVRKRRREGVVEIRYATISPCPYVQIGTLVDEISNKLVWGHSEAFGMSGTITDVENNESHDSVPVTRVN